MFKTVSVRKGIAVIHAGLFMKLLTVSIMCCMMAVPGVIHADEDEVYESMYGSAASLYSTSYGIAFDNLKEGQRLEPYIDKINKIAGFAATVGSATRKAASGDMYGASEETALAILAEVAGWEASGQAYLKAIGLSTGVFQLALTAYSITKESYAQVESTRIARDIESLYGAIESDPVLKPKTGRKLGDKSDPIPVTKQSVEYVFRKVVQDTSWRERLKAYVSQELGQTFPEPSFWDWLNVGGVGGGGAAERAEQAEVFKNRQEIETWIAGLLKRLNDYARAAESEVIMKKTLQEIERAAKKITPEFQTYVVNVEEATKRLPEIEAYARQVPAAIAGAKKDKKWDDLYNIRDRIGYFVRAYVRILPDTGPIGQKKKAVKALLKQSWSDVSKALKDIPKTLQEDFNAQASTPQYSSPFSLTATAVNFIGIDEASMTLYQAKSVQEMEAKAEAITEDAAQKWKRFREQFYKENPVGNDHPQYKNGRAALNQTLTAINASCAAMKIGIQECYNYHKQAEMKALDKQSSDLETQRRNYDAKRQLYADTIGNQYNALVKAIGKLAGEERVRFADTDKLKRAALDKLEAVNRSIPVFYPVTQTKNYQVTAADTRQYLNSFRSAPSEGYLGLPKMKFPKWGENGAAVVEYIESIRRKVSGESGIAYQTNERHKRAMEYINTLKRFISNVDRSIQEFTEVRERVYALNLQADPKAQVITGIEKRIQDMKDIEKLTLEVEADISNKLMADSQKQLASIQDDLAYLDSLLRKVRYWSDAVQMYSTPLYRFGGSVNAVMVLVAIATEGSSGSNRRIFLAPSTSDLSLFDKAKANAAADALLRDIESTGIVKWDPQGDTGLKAFLEAKAAEIRTYAIDSPNYAVVNNNVIYADRIAKMAADVRAIPTSSYGSNTYKEGIKNRSFDEKLGAALRNGTAFAMDIEMKKDTNDQTISVKLDTARGLAANHKNGAIKTASADLVKAIDEHLARYNAQVVQEAKQFAIDYAKAEAEMKLQNECLAKGGVYTNGKCITTPSGPGQAGRPGQPGQIAGTGAGSPPAGAGPMNAQAPGAPGQQAGKPAGTPPAGAPQQAPQPSPPQSQGSPPGGQQAQQPPATQKGPGQAMTQGGLPPAGQAQRGQQPSPTLSGTPPQGSGAQQPRPGVTGSVSQQTGMGPMASLQGAGATQKVEDLTPKVRELYNQFRQAYESRNVSGVMRCLSSQWSSADGGSPSDLQRNLQKVFTMFDEVKFNIQNLQIQKQAEGKYRVSYDVTITSRIYKKNLKHEEKSSINEEVTIEQSGQPKISKTLGGKLLSVK